MGDWLGYIIFMFSTEDMVHGLENNQVYLFNEVLSDFYYLLTECGIGGLIFLRWFLFFCLNPPEFQ